jgi:PAS domain S-box-containing protein
VLRTLPDLVLTVDRRGVVRSANREAGELACAPRVGSTLADWVCREDHEGLYASLAAAFTTGRPARFEGRVRGRGGKTTWFECRLAPAILTRGAAVAVVVATDISGRKVAELALASAYQELDERVRERTRALLQANERLRQENEERRLAEAERKAVAERLRGLIEHMPAATYVRPTGEGLPTIYTSPQIAELSGFEPEAWTADPMLWQSRIHPDDRRRVLAEWTASAATGKPFRSKYRWLKQDGTVAWWRDEAHAVLDNLGRALFHGFLLDVSAEEAEADKRRVAELALRRSDERYRTLFEHNLAGMYRTTLDGRILECNAAFARIYGYDSPAEILMVGAAALYANPEDRQEFIAHLEREGGLVNYLSTGNRRDGSRFHVLETVILADAGNGEPRVLEGVALDLSERKQAEALLAGQTRVLEMIARRAPLRDVLDAIARIAEAQAGGMLCTVLLVDDKSRTLRHGAAPSLPRSFCDAIDAVPIRSGAGACGTAACRGETVIAADIASDPLFADYREIAARYGLRACWSAPVLSEGGRVLGTFAMYFREPRSPSAPERQLIELASGLVALAIERYRAEEALRLRERQLLEAQRVGRVGNWEWDLASDVITGSDELYRIYGQPPRAGVRFDDLLKSVYREDRAAVRETFERALRDGQPFVVQHRVFRPDAGVRVVHMRGEAEADASGRIVRLFGIEQDVTERTRAEARLSRNLDRLQKLFEITTAVNRGADARVVHELAVDALVNGIGADRASITMRDAAGRSSFVASRGLSDACRETLERYSPWPNDARHPEPIVVADVARAPASEPWREAALAEGIRALVFVPVFEDRLLGSFVLFYDTPRAPDEEELQFALTLAGNIGLATQRGRAEQALHASHDRMRRLADHLQQAREEERARIAREVHDELGQTLTALKLDLSWLKGRLARRPELAARVAETSALSDGAIRTVRRISTALRPGVLDDLGLVAAVEWLAHDVEARTGIRCRLEPPFDDLDVGPEASTHIFRLFQEALTNVVRHSGASEVRLKLRLQGADFHGEIRDNGRGMGGPQLADGKTLGLIGMRERARLLGGEIEFAGGPGAGTLVRFRCPLGSAGPQGAPAP